MTFPPAPASISFMRAAGFLFIAFAGAAIAAPPDDLRARVEQELPSLTATYKDLHAHPELSRHEEHTSAFLAGELRKAGFTVTDRVGKYGDGSQAYGVVGILKNGSGPVVMMRTELDALPVEENTGAPFASHVRTKNDAGQEVGVMHACGHDLHMTSFLGTARLLASMKDRWNGTLIMVGQPSEETVDGARAMLADGFYTRFPKPNFILALHDTQDLEAGKVGVLPGAILAGATTLNVTMRGAGGHGARPETTKDPIVMAAEFVMAIQTIVSRQIAPQDPAVVTIGSIHGGSKNNIIPDEVLLQFSVRAFSDEVRSRILASIDRTARGIALAAGVPDDRAPVMKVFDGESTPVTYNDPKLAERLRGVFASVLGDANVESGKPEMVSEDFGLFGLEGHQIPTVMFRLGASDPVRLAESLRTGQPLPSLHSSQYLPQYEPALRTGIIATSAAILDLMKK
jgi:amidohydrolase